jgi:hypothetical protein
MVEEPRKEGTLEGGKNSTFLDLIPKEIILTAFLDSGQSCFVIYHIKSTLRSIMPESRKL